jgi:hypothetical protein
LMNNVMEIFTRIALNIYVAFSSIVIFTVLILLIHKHGMSFHLRCLCWFLSLVTYDFHCIDQSLPSLNFPRYFNLIEGIVNSIVFPISFSNCSLFIYRNATDFHTLIWYPATLLQVFMWSFGWVFGIFQI